MNPDKDIQAAAASQTLAGALAFEIIAKRNQALQDRIDQRDNKNPPPRSYSYLSAVEECDRQMVYAITHPKERAKVDTDLKARFEAGELQENQINVELRQLGFEVILQQEVVEIKDRQGNVIGRGKIDGQILYHGHKIPIEIKSMHPQIFEAVDNLDDFHKKPHLRRYLRQMAMYLYGNNVEEGLFILTDCLGHWKVFVITLDYAEGEQILKRLERVHNHLKAGTQPDRIDYRSEICGKCPFAMVCIPDVLRKEINVLVDEDLLTNLERRDVTAEAKSAYDKADRWVKSFLKGHKIEKGIAGDFIITSKIVNKKEQPAKPATEELHYSIERVSEIGKDREAA